MTTEKPVQHKNDKTVKRCCKTWQQKDVEDDFLHADHDKEDWEHVRVHFVWIPILSSSPSLFILSVQSVSKVGTPSCQTTAQQTVMVGLRVIGLKWLKNVNI